MNPYQAFRLEAMERAIRAAEAGVRAGHRPFGCVIVDRTSGEMLASEYGTESECDPTRHSEVIAIRAACNRRGRLLQDCVLVSTHEPCHMCCGAIKHSKVSEVIWGSRRSDLPLLFRKNHVGPMQLLQDTSDPPVVTPGVLRSVCIALFDDEVRAARRAHDWRLT